MSDPIFDYLNRECHCINTDPTTLDRETRRVLGHGDISLPTWADSSVFANVPVFVSPKHIRTMRDVVAAVSTLTLAPSYRDLAIERAPEIAHHAVPQHGVYLGYDFHLGEAGPALIEINTNAGGAMLNLVLALSQRACCDEVNQFVASGDRIDQLEDEFTRMFRAEWALARGDQPLRTIAIVDDDPETQFLYPEFVLFRELFRRAGLSAFICAPEQLHLEASGLYCAEKRVDLVYNRLVDFYFEEPKHRALRDAYLTDAVVVTPHPRAHAVFADKRNLATLRDKEQHRQAGLSARESELLTRHIPETVLINPRDAQALWTQRKQWFFKPIHGYGSKAAYRGDKLTKGTFAEILGRDYVAQRIVTPSRRHVQVKGAVVPLKLDIRCFAYINRVQLVAARLYDGQTTNFRTRGGGFASVFTSVDSCPPASE
jgi:glutathione synthase/RimK-type ligase-like ATP-grasp enzyme